MSNGTTPPTQVNPQILQAVKKTNKINLGAAQQVGSSAVYEQVAQSAGLAVQDSVDHMQNALTLDSTVTGKALANLFAGKDIPESLLALVVAQLSVEASILNMKEIGKVASEVLSEFAPASSGTSSNGLGGGLL